MDNYILLPTTCVEAQCCGTPVVGFDTGGTKETSIFSQDDFVKYGEVEELSNVVVKRLTTKSSIIVENAHKEYSKETMSNRYMSVYDEKGRKERILLIDVNCGGSSTGKIVYDLYSNLRKDGRIADICYGRGKLVEGENIYKFGIDIETKIHAGLARVTGYNGCFSPLSTKRLIDYIERFNPDLIHIHELHAYFVNIKPLLEYIKMKNIPLVWTFHCEYMYTGKCGYTYDCTNFQRECGRCPAVKDYPKSILFDRTKSMLKLKKRLLEDLKFTIITPSQWLADKVKMSFLKDKDIRVIHNGVDTNVFHPVDSTELRNKLRIPNECKVVLAVAPDIMSERKGGKWVIKLANMMKNDKVFFVFVGGYKSDMTHENVICVGSVYSSKELAIYYSMADCFVLFSKKETYSMTCAESLCCGTPIVGFKRGAPETVFTKDTFFFEYGDIKRVQIAVKKLLGLNETEDL